MNAQLTAFSFCLEPRRIPLPLSSVFSTYSPFLRPQRPEGNGVLCIAAAHHRLDTIALARRTLERSFSGTGQRFKAHTRARLRSQPVRDTLPTPLTSFKTPSTTPALLYLVSTSGAIVTVSHTQTRNRSANEVWILIRYGNVLELRLQHVTHFCIGTISMIVFHEICIYYHS